MSKFYQPKFETFIPNRSAPRRENVKIGGPTIQDGIQTDSCTQKFYKSGNRCVLYIPLIMGSLVLIRGHTWKKHAFLVIGPIFDCSPQMDQCYEILKFVTNMTSSSNKILQMY